MAVTNNLYPCIVDTFMPAFLIDSENENENICRVYFSLSLFNTTEEIKNCQVTIRNQATNLSALNEDKYPSQVMITNLQIDTTKLTEDKYYIEIKPSDMINNNFIIDQYYQVQIRFTSVDAEDPPISADVQAIDEWLADNLLYFSEWSTICLVRGISVPTLSIADYNFGGVTDVYNTYANVAVLGKLNFAYENEIETMKSYQIILRDEDEKILLDSGIIYTNLFTDPNEISYQINYSYEVDNFYSIEIKYETYNLYSNSNTFYIHILQGEAQKLNTTVKAYTDEENGRIVLEIKRAQNYGHYTGQIIIRRTDNKSNFSVWEDMYIEVLEGVSSIFIVWYDYTIESGVWYKYGIQGVNQQGTKTPMIKSKEPVMLLFDHIYLTSKDKQLKIKFNPQINSFKKNVNESRVDTIGGKYPVIRRNGNTNYTSFSLGGIIVSEMDDAGTFTSKDEIYGQVKDIYEEYNEEKEVSNYYDFVYERFFRDKVINFLNNGKAKLFRSPTEGNILVKLMDVNFSPNQQLGRLIWTFTANAYEIDECSLDNYYKYEIYTKETTKVGVIENGSSLLPIRSIVVIHNSSEFPDVGKENVLYIYNKQLYLWNTINLRYEIISVPFWNAENTDIDPTTVLQTNDILYSDGFNLYQKDENEDKYNLISYDSYEEN